MPEVVADFAERREVVEVLGDQAAHRKPVEVGAAGEEDDEQHGEEEAGDRIGGEHQGGRPHVEALAVAHGLGDAQGNRNAVDEEQRPQPEGNGNGQRVQHQIHHRAVLEVAVAEVEPQVVPHHQRETLVGWPVEAELLLQAGDELRIESLAAGVAGLRGRPHRRRRGDGRGGGNTESGGLDDRLLDRAARRELHDDEVDDHDAEQRRHDEEQAAQ